MEFNEYNQDQLQTVVDNLKSQLREGNYASVELTGEEFAPVIKGAAGNLLSRDPKTKIENIGISITGQNQADMKAEVSLSVEKAPIIGDAIVKAELINADVGTNIRLINIEGERTGFVKAKKVVTNQLRANTGDFAINNEANRFIRSLLGDEFGEILSGLQLIPGESKERGKVKVLAERKVPISQTPQPTLDDEDNLPSDLGDTQPTNIDRESESSEDEEYNIEDTQPIKVKREPVSPGVEESSVRLTERQEKLKDKIRAAVIENRTGEFGGTEEHVYDPGEILDEDFLSSVVWQKLLEAADQGTSNTSVNFVNLGGYASLLSRFGNSDLIEKLGFDSERLDVDRSKWGKEVVAITYSFKAENVGGKRSGKMRGIIVMTAGDAETFQKDLLRDPTNLFDAIVAANDGPVRDKDGALRDVVVDENITMFPNIEFGGVQGGEIVSLPFTPGYNPWRSKKNPSLKESPQPQAETDRKKELLSPGDIRERATHYELLMQHNPHVDSKEQDKHILIIGKDREIIVEETDRMGNKVSEYTLNRGAYSGDDEGFEEAVKKEIEYRESGYDFLIMRKIPIYKDKKEVDLLLDDIENGRTFKILRQTVSSKESGVLGKEPTEKRKELSPGEIIDGVDYCELIYIKNQSQDSEGSEGYYELIFGVDGSGYIEDVDREGKRINGDAPQLRYMTYSNKEEYEQWVNNYVIHHEDMGRSVVRQLPIYKDMTAQEMEKLDREEGRVLVIGDHESGEKLPTLQAHPEGISKPRKNLPIINVDQIGVSDDGKPIFDVVEGETEPKTPPAPEPLPTPELLTLEEQELLLDRWDQLSINRENLEEAIFESKRADEIAEGEQKRGSVFAKSNKEKAKIYKEHLDLAIGDYQKTLDEIATLKFKESPEMERYNDAVRALELNKDPLGPRFKRSTVKLRKRETKNSGVQREILTKQLEYSKSEVNPEDWIKRDLAEKDGALSGEINDLRNKLKDTQDINEKGKLHREIVRLFGERINLLENVGKHEVKLGSTPKVKKLTSDQNLVKPEEMEDIGLVGDGLRKVDPVTVRRAVGEAFKPRGGEEFEAGLDRLSRNAEVIKKLEETAKTANFKGHWVSKDKLVLEIDGKELRQIGGKSYSRRVFEGQDDSYVIKVSAGRNEAWQELIAENLVPEDKKHLLVIPSKHGSFKVDGKTFYYVEQEKLNTIGITDEDVRELAKELEPYLGKGEMGYAGQWGRRADGSLAIYDYLDWEAIKAYQGETKKKVPEVTINIPDEIIDIFRLVKGKDIKPISVQSDFLNYNLEIFGDELKNIYPPNRERKAKALFERAEKALNENNWSQVVEVLDELNTRWRGGNTFYRKAAEVNAIFEKTEKLSKEEIQSVINETIKPVLDIRGLDPENSSVKFRKELWKENFGEKTPDEIVDEVRKKLQLANKESEQGEEIEADVEKPEPESEPVTVPESKKPEKKSKGKSNDPREFFLRDYEKEEVPKDIVVLPSKDKKKKPDKVMFISVKDTKDGNGKNIKRGFVFSLEGELFKNGKIMHITDIPIDKLRVRRGKWIDAEEMETIWEKWTGRVIGEGKGDFWYEPIKIELTEVLKTLLKEAKLLESESEKKRSGASKK